MIWDFGISNCLVYMATAQACLLRRSRCAALLPVCLHFRSFIKMQTAFPALQSSNSNWKSTLVFDLLFLCLLSFCIFLIYACKFCIRFFTWFFVTLRLCFYPYTLLLLFALTLTLTLASTPALTPFLLKLNNNSFSVIALSVEPMRTQTQSLFIANTFVRASEMARPQAIERFARTMRILKRDSVCAAVNHTNATDWKAIAAQPND